MSSKERIVVGIHAAKEVIRVRPKSIKEIWIKAKSEKDRDLLFFSQWGQQYKVSVKSKSPQELDKLASSHQGIALMVNGAPSIEIDEIASIDRGVVLALDEISDPHNVGAILRSAWLLGVKAVLVPINRAAHLTPAVAKVASGGVEHVPMYVCDNLAYDLSYLKDRGFWIYGLDGSASTNLYKTRFNEKVILCVGSEDKGIRSTTRNVCDELISIPQTTKEASFNASVAAALVTYEVFRQHKTP